MYCQNLKLLCGPLTGGWCSFCCHTYFIFAVSYWSLSLSWTPVLLCNLYQLVLRSLNAPIRMLTAGITSTISTNSAYLLLNYSKAYWGLVQLDRVDRAKLKGREAKGDEQCQSSCWSWNMIVGKEQVDDAQHYQISNIPPVTVNSRAEVQ